MKTTIIQSARHFHEVRSGLGGSSEAPALYGRGYENMPSPWSLWAYHSGKLDLPGLDDEPRVRIGKRMEALIAAEVSFVTGWDLRHQIDGSKSVRQIHVRHPDASLKMGCVVDRYVVEHEDGIGLIECKNRDYLQWAQNYTDDDPSARDLIQLCHQFACHPGVAWGVIAVLVGGNDLKIYPIKRSDVEDGIADVEGRWREHWRRVKESDEPTLTGDEIPAWLRAHEENLLATDESNVIRIDDNPLADPADPEKPPVKTFDHYVEDYRVALERRLEYDKIEKAAKAAVLQRIGDHGVGVSNYFRVSVKFSHVKQSAVELPAGVRSDLVAMLEDDDMPAGALPVIRDLIDWRHVTRRAGVRVAINIVDADQPDTHPDAMPAALKRGMEAQAPLKKGSTNS